MKTKLPTVSIGIPAYNEEVNIRRLLVTLLAQRQHGFILHEIVVVSDGSTDKTVSEVQRIRDPRIHLIRNKRRRGQAYSQNRFFSHSTTDIVVVCEADTMPQSGLYLSRLIRPLLHDPDIGIVQGIPWPVMPPKLVGRMLCLQARAYIEYVLRFADSSWFLCSGRGGRAFTSRVYQFLRWPDGVPEDTYALLWGRLHGLKSFVAGSAICSYWPSPTLRHHIAQRNKTRMGLAILAQCFPQALVQHLGVYRRSPRVTARIFLYSVLRYPLSTVGYVCIKVLVSLFFSRDGDFDAFALKAHELRSLMRIGPSR